MVSKKLFFRLIANEAKVPSDYEVSRAVFRERGRTTPARKKHDLISKTFKILLEKYKWSLESN